MYHQVNIHLFYVLTKECIYVFCVDLRTESFSTFNIIRLAFITDIYPFKAQWSLYVPPVQHLSILRSAQKVNFCVLCGSENSGYIPVKQSPTGFYN